MGDGYSLLRLPPAAVLDPDLGVHDVVDPDDFLPMDAAGACRRLREVGADLADDRQQGRWRLETVDVLLDLTLDDDGRLLELELDVGGVEGRPSTASELMHVLATARGLAGHLGARLFDEAGVEVDDAHVADLLRRCRRL